MRRGQQAHEVQQNAQTLAQEGSAAAAAVVVVAAAAAGLYEGELVAGAFAHAVVAEVTAAEVKVQRQGWEAD